MRTGSGADVGEGVMTATKDRRKGPCGVRMGNFTGDCDGPLASGVEGRFSLIVVPGEAMAMIQGVVAV